MAELLFSTHSYLAGLLSGISCICLMGYAYYRDPAVLNFALYSGTAALAEGAPFYDRMFSNHEAFILLFNIGIWTCILCFYQSIARIILNLQYYAGGYFRYFIISRLAINASLPAIGLALAVFADAKSALSIVGVCVMTIAVWAHINVFIAARLCATSGHKGTHYILLTSGSFGVILVASLVFFFVISTPMRVFDISFASAKNRAILLAELLLLGAAILFRMSRQYLANQKVLADLILSESTALDHRLKLVELRQNFETAVTNNIERPTQRLVRQIQDSENLVSEIEGKIALDGIRKTAENLLSSVQILGAEIFQNPNQEKIGRHQRALPPAEVTSDENLSPPVTGRVILFSTTELLSLSYRNILGNAGFEIVTAESAKAVALLAASLEDAHLVLIVCATEGDIATGLELCLALRQKKPRTQLPVIAIMPALYSPEQITDFFAAGASDVFTKFLSEAEMIARLKANVEYALMAAELTAWHADLEARIRQDTELLRLQGRMNPHFLFNSLNTVYSLLNTDKKAAERALLLLSDIYRFYLEFSYESLIPLSLEWEFTRNYLELSKIRYGKFLKIAMAEVFDAEGRFKIPPLSLQPLVENGIKHGLTEHERDARLTIIGKTRGDGVEITITDNGPGIQSIDHSRSLGNIKKRLLFHYHHVDLQLQNKPGGGALCALRFSGFKSI